MDLYQELVAEGLRRGVLKITMTEQAHQWVELRCLHALEQIRGILDNGALSDKECFERIGEIVSVFEELGSDGGIRHDFV